MPTSFDFTELGQWPSDCFDQQVYIENLQTKLNELQTFIVSNSNQVVTLSQATEPTQGQWEAAWVIQTGLPLPIPPSGILLWYDTTNSTFGGEYGTVTGSSTVAKRVAEFIKGTVVYLNQSNDTTARSSTRSLYDNSSLLPTLSFTTYVQCTLIFEFIFSCTGGASNGGADLMLDNVKLGTQYNGVNANGGILENFPSARQSLSYYLTGVAAGAHVARPLLGVVGAPATPTAVQWGGLGAVTSFSIRAVME